MFKCDWVDNVHQGRRVRMHKFGIIQVNFNNLDVSTTKCKNLLLSVSIFKSILEIQLLSFNYASHKNFLNVTWYYAFLKGISMTLCCSPRISKNQIYIFWRAYKIFSRSFGITIRIECYFILCQDKYSDESSITHYSESDSISS